MSDNDNNFINYLPISQKYKDILFANMISDLSIYNDLGKITITKFIVWNQTNDFENFIKELHEYSISFIGYAEYILDTEIQYGVGYGVAYTILKEFYNHFLESKNFFLKK